MMTTRCIGLAAGSLLLLSACASTPEPAEPRTAEITRREGPPVVVPLEGPLATPATKGIVERIQAIDADLARWRSSVSGDPEVIAAMERVALETREDAVEELEKALAIAESTSGPLDFLFRDADEKLDDTREVLAASPPASVWCRSEITAVPDGAFIHYMAEGDFADGRREWSSYSPGALLRIGRYRFRVTQGEEHDYDEVVTVVADPTVARLQPGPDSR